MPIKGIVFTTLTRDRLSCLYRALQEIYITTEYNKKIFSILEEEITVKTRLPQDRSVLIIERGKTPSFF